jgi:hypothetical protein
MVRDQNVGGMIAAYVAAYETKQSMMQKARSVPDVH